MMNAQVKLHPSNFSLKDHNGGLSSREWEVMLAISNGESPAATAKRLKLSVKTVSTYRARIFLKTGAKSNVELALYAFRQGLVQ